MAAAGFTAWFFHSPTSRDYHFYQRLMSYSDADKQVQQNQAIAKQERVHVQKQLMFKQDCQRLQWRLESAHSEVFLSKNGNGMEFIEKLHGMTGTMQEKILNVADDETASAGPFQLIRKIEAEDATYRYRNRQLLANQVRLTRYRIPETRWIQDLSSYHPYMEGQAQSIQMILSRQPAFKAQNFQAIFQEWE